MFRAVHGNENTNNFNQISQLTYNEYCVCVCRWADKNCVLEVVKFPLKIVIK